MAKLFTLVLAVVFGMTFGGMTIAKAADQTAPIMVADGKAGEDHGKAGEDHGKAGEDHGKAKGDQEKSKGKGKKKGQEKKEH
ncbi:MAG: hypothetical protein AB7P17_04740 [Nitrospirales bacterium]|nr:hypothetical protein [Nitrospirales bacterium]